MKEAEEQSQREIWLLFISLERHSVAGFEDEGRGPWAKESDSL